MIKSQPSSPKSRQVMNMSSASCRDSTKMFSPLRNANLNSSQIMNSPHPVLSDTSSKEYINLRKKPILLDADKPFNGSG